MRGADTFTESLFAFAKLEGFVPANHPFRSIHTMANMALVKLGPLFAGMCEPEFKSGRPSIAPEKLLRAMLLQVLCSVAANSASVSQAHCIRRL